MCRPSSRVEICDGHRAFLSETSGRGFDAWVVSCSGLGVERGVEVTLYPSQVSPRGTSGSLRSSAHFG